VNLIDILCQSVGAPYEFAGCPTLPTVAWSLECAQTSLWVAGSIRTRSLLRWHGILHEIPVVAKKHCCHAYIIRMQKV